MTSPKQINANRGNAALSTGPKTAGGRSRSSKNALRHGAFSSLPVLPGLESAEDWESHRAGILESLAPLGGLEEALARRVAVCSWRLERTVRYETAVTAVGLEKIEETLRPRMPSKSETILQRANGVPDEAALAMALKEIEEKQKTMDLWSGTDRLLEQINEIPDQAAVVGDDVYGFLESVSGELSEDQKGPFDVEAKDFLARLGVPKDEQDDPWSWSGWTAGTVRRAVALIAQAFKRDPNKLLAKALEGRREVRATFTDEIKALERKAKKIRLRQQVKKDRMVRQSMLPDSDTLQQIARYEAHLSRQMLQALHELQRLQAARVGVPVLPPAALDVTLDAGETALEAIRDASTG